MQKEAVKSTLFSRQDSDTRDADGVDGGWGGMQNFPPQGIGSQINQTKESFDKKESERFSKNNDAAKTLPVPELTERFGEYLIRLGVITEDDLMLALQQSRTKNTRLGETLVNMGKISSNKFLEVMSGYFQIPYVLEITPQMIHMDIFSIWGKPKMNLMKCLPLIPEKAFPMVYNYNQQPVENNLLIAISDPGRPDIVAKLRNNTQGLEVVFVLAPLKTIEALIDDPLQQSTIESIEYLDDSQIDDGVLVNMKTIPAERIVEEAIITAWHLKATDIHIENYTRDQGLLIRMRRHGDLQEYQKYKVYPKAAFGEVIAYIKVKGGMAPDQKLLPQDGSWQQKIGTKTINVRAAVIPTVFKSEKVTLRLLSKSLDFSLDTLGLPNHVRDDLKKITYNANGLVLITGPTGSGKTSTIYATLKNIDVSKKKVYSIEDPVEYTLPLTTQIQVNIATGLTFAQSLRSIVRHDPDVVFVGEIRDAETANIALQLAATGHLVFSSIHTTDAISVLSRIYSMGIEPHLVCNTLTLAVGQRLIKTCCPHCKEKYQPTIDQQDILKLPADIDYYHSVGCKICNFTGIEKRIPLAESANFYQVEALEAMYRGIQDEQPLKKYFVEILKMKTMYLESLSLMKKGITSPDFAIQTVSPSTVDTYLLDSGKYQQYLD